MSGADGFRMQFFHWTGSWRMKCFQTDIRRSAQDVEEVICQTQGTISTVWTAVRKSEKKTGGSTLKNTEEKRRVCQHFRGFKPA